MENKLLDELSLVNEKEKPFSDKILAILGGVASFGALFPLFLSNLSRFTDVTDTFWPFKIFMAVYFLLPMVILFLWLFVSRRGHLLGNSDPVIRQASRSFFFMLGVQFVFGLAFILFRTQKMTPGDGFFCGVVYSCLILATLYVFYRALSGVNRLMSSVAIFASLVIVLVMLFAMPGYIGREQRADGAVEGKEAYRQLGKLGTLGDTLSAVKKRSENMTERYMLQSHMQWLAYGVSDTLAEKFSRMAEDSLCRNYVMKPYLGFFYDLVLSKDSTQKEFVAFMAGLPQNRIDDKLEKLFDLNAIYNSYVPQKCKGDTLGAGPNPSANSLGCISALISAVGASIGSKPEMVSAGSLESENIERLFQNYHVQTGNPEMKMLFAAYLNERNSRQLHSWMQDFMVEVERRTQDEVSLMKKSVSWILRDAQITGLFIFITLLMSILMYYVLISSLGVVARKKAQVLAVEGKVDGEMIKKALDIRLRMLQLYLFPVVTFVAIVVALIIPLVKPIVAEEINPTKPGWFLSMSNWNVTGAIKESVKELPVAKLTGGAAETKQEEKAVGSDVAQRDVLRDMVTKDEFQEAITRIAAKIDATSNDAKAVKQYINRE